MSEKKLSLRLPDAVMARLEAFAKANDMKFSSAVRMVINRGLLVVEMEQQTQSAPRRRVLSKGVG